MLVVIHLVVAIIMDQLVWILKMKLIVVQVIILKIVLLVKITEVIPLTV